MDHPDRGAAETAPGSRFRSILLPLLCALSVVALVFALQLAPTPGNTAVWQEVFDAGHVPLFGVLAWIILWLSRGLFRDGTRRRNRYLAVFAVSAALGVASESLQVFFPRNADPFDMLRNLLGAGAFLMIAASLDGETRHKSWLRYGAVALLVASFAPLASLGIDFARRNAEFPVLYDFGSRRHAAFVRTMEAELDRVAPPADWDAAPGRRVARVVFLRGLYPGLRMGYPFPDWTGFDRLVLDVYSEEPVSRTLYFRINDEGHGGAYKDRFNRRLTILPGANRIEFPLSEIRDSPESRQMDLSRIVRMALYGHRPEERFTLYFSTLRLTRDEPGSDAQEGSR